MQDLKKLSIRRLVSCVSWLWQDDQDLGPGVRRAVGMTFMFMACVIGFMQYTIIGKWWWPETEVTLKPDLLSIVLAIIFVVPLYLRRIIIFRHTFVRLLSGAMNITIVGILWQALLGKASPSFVGLPMPTVLALAIGFIWLGMRPLAVVAWFGVLVLGTINLQFASAAMGLWGWVFALLVLGGAVLNPDIDWAGFRRDLPQDFWGSDRPQARLAAPDVTLSPNPFDAPHQPSHDQMVKESTAGA